MSSQLVTGEAVALDLRPARLPSRVLAAVIDLAIEFFVLSVLLQLVTAVALIDEEFALALTIVLVAAFVVGYPVAFETLWRGLTPGKAAMGIRVVRDDGGPIRFRHALSRALLNIVERPGVTFGSAAVIASLLSRRGKRLGDLVAGTFVLQERVPRQHFAPAYMPMPLAGWAQTLDLSRLPDDLALAVRGFIGRSQQLRPEARERLGGELAAAVASYVTPPPPPGTPGWAYLSAVVAERRRRDEARMPATYQGWGGAQGGPPQGGPHGAWQGGPHGGQWGAGGWPPGAAPPGSVPPGAAPPRAPAQPALAGPPPGWGDPPGTVPPWGSRRTGPPPRPDAPPPPGWENAPAGARSPARDASGAPDAAGAGGVPGAPGGLPAAPPGAPSPWQPGAPSPGWGGAPRDPRWGASAPPTGAPPPVGPPPPVAAPPEVPTPPRVPAAPSPQWGPPPVPASPPPRTPADAAPASSAPAGSAPAGGGAAPAAAVDPARDESPPAAPPDGPFAAPA
ncbi:MAG TPA: RDD family protein [Mycobacteriales bacterium]|nr:RDD family protein [Mycobacteriales bacterium]